MKITCPKCKSSGNIPEHEIPEAGRFVSCPNCSQGFTVMKPRATRDMYLVDTCPSCNFSTFGDETFGTCPKCGTMVKAFYDRQREERQQQHTRKAPAAEKMRANAAPLPPPPSPPPVFISVTDVEPEPDATPVADFIENLHPVNLIGWGVALFAVIIFGIGLWGLLGYDSAEIKLQLADQFDEPVSGTYVFLHYGIIHWFSMLYGMVALWVAIMFLKHLRISLKAMSRLIWFSLLFVPVYYIGSFVFWVLAPIPHTIGGYLIEIFNIIFMSSLVGIPLFVLDRYLLERTITSVVRR